MVTRSKPAIPHSCVSTHRTAVILVMLAQVGCFCAHISLYVEQRNTLVYLFQYIEEGFYGGRARGTDVMCTLGSCARCLIKRAIVIGVRVAHVECSIGHTRLATCVRRRRRRRRV